MKRIGYILILVSLFVTTSILAKPYSLGMYNKGESAGDQYISLSVGPQLFFGDLFLYRLKNSVSPLTASPAATIGYRYQSSNLLGFKGKLMLGTLIAPQYDVENFNSPLTRLYGGVAAGVEFELLQIPRTYDNEAPQLLLGVGVGVYFSTAASNQTFLVKSIDGALSAPANEPKVSFALPMTLAYYYPMSKYIYLFAEGSATLLSSEVDVQTRKDVAFNGTLSLQLGVSYKF